MGMNRRDFTTLPLILPKTGRSSTLSAAADAAVFGLSSIASAGAKAAELAPLAAEELLQNLHRKLHEANQACGRAGWFGGQFYNWALGVDVDYITLSGTHLTQTIALFDLKPLHNINRTAQYLLRADVALQAHNALGAQLGVSSGTLTRGIS